MRVKVGWRLAFLDGCGGYKFLDVGFGFGLEGFWRVGESSQDLVWWGDGFGGVDGAPADGLVDAVEDGGEGFFHSHVFDWLAEQCQSAMLCRAQRHPYPSSSVLNVARSIWST